LAISSDTAQIRDIKTSLNVRHLEGTPDANCFQRRAGSTDEYDPRRESDPLTGQWKE